MIRLSVVLAVVVLSAGTSAVAKPRAADTVLRHGDILTVDSHDRVVEALAIRKGRIVALGSDRAIAAYIGPRTQVIDLAGRTATPGMIDAHAHALETGVEAVSMLQLYTAASVDEVLAPVRARAARLPAGAMIVGTGWNEARIAEHRAPTLAELDAASGDHPVALINATGHYWMVNSTVLRLAKIDAATPDPAAGRIGHDSAGAPNGLLYERGADAAYDLIPKPDAAVKAAGLRRIFEEALAAGVTALKDPRTDRDEWEVYLQAAKTAPLPMHVCTLVYAQDTMATAQAALGDWRKRKQEVAALPGRRLDVCGAKIFLDGSAAGRNAWMNAPYAADAEHKTPGVGFPAVDPEVYRQMVDLFNRNGVPVGTHAIGDRAIDVALDAYAAALKASPQVGLRHSIIHGHIPTDHALDVMADLQKRFDAGYPESQAEFMWTLGDSLASAFGPERSARTMPFATYRRLGLIYSDGSDAPVTPIAPRYGLWASVAREASGGRLGKHPFGTAEAVDIHTALRSHTIWAARQLFLEKDIGSLERGKLADIAVWDRNPYTVPTAELKDMHCTLTLVEGKVAYKAP